MPEDRQLKEILKRAGVVGASPKLEDAIMSRVHQVAATREKGYQPLLNVRLLLGLVLTYTVLSLLLLLICFMLDQGYAFEAANIPAVFAIKSSNAATLALSLLGFWTLVLANFFFKNHLNRSFSKS